jgi:hypothetical protein
MEFINLLILVAIVVWAYRLETRSDKTVKSLERIEKKLEKFDGKSKQ